MPSELQSRPLLSPQTDNAGSAGGLIPPTPLRLLSCRDPASIALFAPPRCAKKKGKKKLAAAKAAAAQDNNASTKQANITAASNGPVKQNGAQHEGIEAEDEVPSAPAIVKSDQQESVATEDADVASPRPDGGQSAPLDTETPPNLREAPAKGENSIEHNTIPTETDTASTSDNDKDSTAAATVESSSHTYHAADDNEAAIYTAPLTPTVRESSTTSSPHSATHNELNGETLRSELKRLQKQVEGLIKEQELHTGEIEQLRSELQESEAGREEAETKYDNLLGRVGKIKETLDSRLKRDQEELEEARNHIEELERQNNELRKSSEEAEAAAAAAATLAASRIARLQKELDDAEHDYEHEHRDLQDQARLAHQTLLREKEELLRQTKQLRAELESTSNAMSEWEVIAMEERSVRNTMTEKATDLEEQIDVLREEHQRVLAENVSQSDTINSLQRALNDVQEARKHELREIVQESEAKLEVSEARAKSAEQVAEAAKAEVEKLTKELDRKAPFEAEAKEKALLMSKLRHELLVSNDYLAKALRYIKHVNPEDSVNKGVITNNLVAFLVLDRSDPKKFEILQILASILEWKDDVKEKVGLARPGASANTLRLPASPFGRTPSAPALHAAIFSEPVPTGANQPSLSELWTSFLKKSVDSDALDGKPLPPDASAASSVQASVTPSTQSSRPGSEALP
ncbi:hypothetical protein SEPCBS119000_006405 [Sporothrix epigloea]|uniref:GRIP domain-containing protein n=1 Tax=Sporothrix epigloea TaxID=1892477 RepID=A0ABP0E451_9PEZI